MKNNVNSIENKIKQIEEMPYNEINYTKKQSLEKELNEIYERKSKGAYIRSRANWIRYGDKCTFFKSREKTPIYIIMIFWEHYATFMNSFIHPKTQIREKFQNIFPILISHQN